MDEEELAGFANMGKIIATVALQNAVDAVNSVFGAGSAKLDTPLVAAAFAAQSQFLSGMVAAASMAPDEMGFGDDDVLDKMFNS